VSIIEQAVRRLEELRRSGIEVPMGASSAGEASTAEHVPARAARLLQEVPSGTSVLDAGTLASNAPAHAQGPAQPARSGITSRTHSAAESRSKPVDIDLERLAAMGYVTPDRPRSQIADEFRVIKRPLLLNVNGKSAGTIVRPNLIMVTSSLPGEGKTFVTTNIALSMAMELNKRVLLVDADVSRPSLLPRLGLTAPPVGLLDLLENPSLALSDVLLRTNVDKLSLLPAGTPRGQATELLASEAMSQLLEELASRYADRIVIFDAPPLLPSPESRVLATHMGQVIMVVEASKTPQKTVTQALATIESCPVVMPLLNKASHSEVGFYYGYYGPVEG
jgi:exopolysaccharide/PEP-CTERM locus tyrosine autokinase